MNKKKVLTLVLSLGLIGAIGVGATLAYFTDRAETVTNVVTMGNVDITLEEQEPNPEGPGNPTMKEDGGINYEGVLPGDTLEKVADVIVADTSNATYIRVMAEVTGTEDTQIIADIEAAIETSVEADGNWLKVGDYYYLITPGVTPIEAAITNGGTTVNFLESFTVPTAWTNDQAKAEFNVELTAEAIQADNFTVDMTSATPWGGVTVETYEPATP